MPDYKHSREINEILAKFRRGVPQVMMASVISQDGIVLGTDESAEFTQDRFSLMSASIISLGGRVSLNLDIGDPEQICMVCKSGIVLLTSVKGRGSLCCITSAGARLGSVLYEMRKISEELAPYVYPVNYGTAFLKPEILDQFEKEHAAPPAPKDERPIPPMRTEYFLRQPDTNSLRKTKK